MYRENEGADSEHRVNVPETKVRGFQRFGTWPERLSTEISASEYPYSLGLVYISLYPVKSEDLPDYVLSFQIVFTERLTVHHLRYA